MATLYLTTRTLHVLLGAFWAGSIFFALLFLDPAVRRAGPAGGRVMAELARRRWMPTILSVGTLTVVSGLYLMWEMSGHFSPAFMGSRPGILLSTGMLAGILILAIGFGMTRPTSVRIGVLAGRIAAAGASPSPDDAAELERLRGRMTVLLRIVSVLMVVAVVTMALGPHA